MPDDAATKSSTEVLDGKTSEAKTAEPGAKVSEQSPGVPLLGSTEAKQADAKIEAKSESTPVSEAKVSKADENDIKTYSKVGATL